MAKDEKEANSQESNSQWSVQPTNKQDDKLREMQTEL